MKKILALQKLQTLEPTAAFDSTSSIQCGGDLAVDSTCSIQCDVEEEQSY